MIMWMVAQAGAVIATCIIVYVNIRVKLKELEIRVNNVERQDNMILKKLEQISEQIHDLQLQLKDKVDKQ